MRDYGKVHTSFWTSETTRGLSEDGRTLALYLLTSPHGTIAGVFRLPDGYVCEDLQWSPERVAKAFAETLAKGFANRCETTKWVWICKFLTWNQPENPNQRKGALKAALLAPKDCCWFPDFMRVCGELLGLKHEAKANPFETLSKPFLNQEQEQEQDIGCSDLLAQSEHDPPEKKSEPETEFAIPLVDSTEYRVLAKDLAEWVRAYPAVDVRQELLQVRAWVMANPAKRKTRRGVASFLVRWLSKAQDTPRGSARAFQTALASDGIGRFV